MSHDIGCCQNCRHYSTEETMRNLTPHCRRYPPLPLYTGDERGIITGWPAVMPEYYCGEWAP